MTTSPFDESPARRPTVQDLGGAAKINGTVAPDPVTMLTADDMNQWGLVGAGVAGVCPLAIVVVTQVAGVYSIAGVRSPGSAVVAATFTPTKNGTGDVTLTWASGALPGALTCAASLQSGAGDYGYEATLPTANTFRIKVKDHTNTAQESNFTAIIY